MFKKLLQVIIIVVLFAALYNFRVELGQYIAPYTKEIRVKLGLPGAITPCVDPIPYQLDGFDTKFGISKEYFLSALSDAEAIWEQPYGKELFVYSPDSTSSDTLKVNLVYDYRQDATKKLENAGIVVSDNRSSYEELKAKFDTLKVSYEQEKSAYDARVRSFNHSERTNAHEYQSLQNEQKKLNQKADEINAMVVALNHLIDTLNLSVQKYNSTNNARGESFEEGVYVSDGYNSKIDIYEFSNRAKLVRVLAHELGHALGLDHVDDPKAIMYELNQSNSDELSPADFKALEALCAQN